MHIFSDRKTSSLTKHGVFSKNLSFFVCIACSSESDCKKGTLDWILSRFLCIQYEEYWIVLAWSLYGFNSFDSPSLSSLTEGIPMLISSLYPRPMWTTPSQDYIASSLIYYSLPHSKRLLNQFASYVRLLIRPFSHMKFPVSPPDQKVPQKLSYKNFKI